jgi:hypothetical protein
MNKEREEQFRQVSQALFLRYMLVREGERQPTIRSAANIAFKDADEFLNAQADYIEERNKERLKARAAG